MTQFALGITCSLPSLPTVEVRLCYCPTLPLANRAPSWQALPGARGSSRGGQEEDGLFSILLPCATHEGKGQTNLHVKG